MEKKQGWMLGRARWPVLQEDRDVSLGRTVLGEATPTPAMARL